MGRDKLGRFVKGNIPPYAGRELPLEIKAKLRAKALIPRRLEISIANLHPDGANVAKRVDIRERIAEAHRGHKASQETRHKMSEIHKKRQQDLALREQTAASLREYCKDPNVRERKIEASKGRQQSVDEKRKKSQATGKNWGNSEIREKRANGIREAHARPEVKAKLRAGIHRRWQKPSERQRQSLLSKQLWQNPDYIKKVFEGIGRRPTKPEQILDSILYKYFPEFSYNGDYSLGIMIAGQIPDFVNVNGRKEIIEVFGDYHHSPEVLGNRWQGSELGKVMLYNSLGWKCLIIWEHQINELTEEELIQKIGTFFGGGRQNARTT